MIAICREDSVRKSREERYALRRVLVARLQKVSRGIPRRSRFESHRQFATEWERCTREGRLDLVHRALVVGPAVAAEAGEDWRSSFLLSLAADSATLRPVSRPIAESGGAQATSALDSSSESGSEPRPWSDAGRPVGLQAELFPTQLIPQPA
jgi:hypothetical protein